MARHANPQPWKRCTAAGEEHKGIQAHPLAATIALRSMVDFTLANARSSRYGHAAYLAPIRQNHARKSGFWKRMQDTGMAQSG